MMHDVSESEYQQIQTWHQSIKSGHLYDLNQKLEIIERALSDINLQLERTPDADMVSGLLQEVKMEQAAITTLKKDKQILIDKMRVRIRLMMDEMRKANKLEEMLVNSDQVSTNIQLAAGVRKLLEDFVSKMRQQKVHELETRFKQAFTRLARKEDMLIKAKIDPLTFDVQLIGKNEKVVKKKKLSAGEKQIYAIAMLEALAQTSGKRLPVIIDTPLGRLDSKHRAKLVEHYFPKASHQVIILSTDTEVDSKFYSDLGPHISHAYSIHFDEQEGASSLTEGYFWKSQKKELSRVS
jgi:DNA sulfur modification protein DndD